MKGILSSCQGSSLRCRSTSSRGEAGNGLFSRDEGKCVFVQRNGRRRGMVQTCKIMGNRGSFSMGNMASKRGVGRVGSETVVVKAVRNAKGQRIDPEDVQVKSSMGEGSFGQVFQVSVTKMM